MTLLYRTFLSSDQTTFLKTFDSKGRNVNIFPKIKIANLQNLSIILLTRRQKLHLLSIVTKETTYKYNLFFQKQYYRIPYIIYFALSLSIHRKIKKTFPKIFIFSKSNIFSLFDIVTKETTSISTQDVYKDNPRSRYIKWLYRQKLFSHPIKR